MDLLHVIASRVALYCLSFRAVEEWRCVASTVSGGRFFFGDFWDACETISDVLWLLNVGERLPSD